MKTIGDLLDFVMLNRGTTTFMGFTEERIAAMLKEGVEENTLFYALDNDGKIRGMILAVKDEKHGILFVTENLAMNMNNLKVFAKKAHATWPHLSLQAIRHGSHRIFNTGKLYHKLIT